MIRTLLTFTVVIPMLCLFGCAKGEYEASNEHCLLGYLANKPVHADTYALRRQCLTGYHTSAYDFVESSK